MNSFNVEEVILLRISTFSIRTPTHAPPPTPHPLTSKRKKIQMCYYITNTNNELLVI